MIDVLPPRGQLRVLAGSPSAETVSVPHVACAVPSARLARYSRPLKQIATRWGINAASSLMAHLGDVLEAPNYVLVVQDFGPVAWVEHGHGMMRPLILTPLFVQGDAWVACETSSGLEASIIAAADACLEAPKRTLEALCQVTHARLYDTPELVKTWNPEAPEPVLALARPAVAVGREVHALVEFAGSVGPLVLEVDTGTATLRALMQKPWAPQALK